MILRDDGLVTVVERTVRTLMYPDGRIEQCHDERDGGAQFKTAAF